MTRIMALALVLAGLALPSMAEVKDAKGLTIKLPSGAELRWLETRHDTAGGGGLTYRFRFLMPELAKHLPAGEAAAPLPESQRGPIDVDTDSEEVSGDAQATTDDGMIDPKDLAEAEVTADDKAEEAADAMVDAPASADPAADLPEDPLHDDVVWLCQTWVLPRVAAPAPRPSQIVISLSDKEVPFGSYDPKAVQVFEAFSIDKDRSHCEWEPW